jgi:hypothetical protein
MKAQMGGEGELHFFFNLGARWEGVVSTTPWPLYPQERDPVPLVQEAEWLPEPVRKISPPPEFDSRTVQPVASRCTN